MAQTIADRTIALAGLFQSVAQVRKIAQDGRDITPPLEAAIHSLFMLDAPNVAAVYGGLEALRPGLQALRTQLGGKRDGPRDVEVARYAVSVLLLERKFHRAPDMQEKLREGIESAQAQAAYFGSETHANVIARLGDLYQQTISTLSPRILVNGDPHVLANSDNAALIRALLLAAIRSAVLWRQCGGTRWQLLLRRRALIETAVDLLEH